MEEWNEKKEKRILRRYRFVLTYRILRVLMILGFCYFVYLLTLNIIYDSTAKGNKLNTYASLAVDWTYPGLSSDFHRKNRTEISPLWTQHATVTLTRTIGKEQVYAGDLHVKKPFITSFTQKQYDILPNLEPKFSFYLPYHPVHGQSLGANERKGVWETLDRIHEGTVADLAFSTKDYYTPEEMFKLLADFDVDFQWMALYMGEMVEFKPNLLGSSSNTLSVQPWGLTHGKSVGEDYHVIAVQYLGPANSVEVQSRMLQNMERIYTEDPKLVEMVFQDTHFEKRLNYLKEHGFQVYGAVVTGPVKELLRLQELDEIQGVQLGEITYWNWSR